MDRRQTGKRIVSCIVMLSLLSVSLLYLNNLMVRKDSEQKFREFYVQEENFDVLFLGSSHMYNGISPMDLWKEYGIVSYNLASSGCKITASYWILKNALRYTSPKLVVLDCAYLSDTKVNQNKNYNHRIFDSMPLDRMKLEAIGDLYDGFKDRMSFICPFSLYHERWSELGKKDFEIQYNIGKMGFDPHATIVEVALPSLVSPYIKDVNNVSTEYLKKIIEECQAKGIDVLLTFLPFNENEDSQNHAAYIYEVAREYGIHYLPPDDLLEAINIKTDFANSQEDNSHLNFSGAHKMSDYVGNYIVNNYDIPDQRNNQVYDCWDGYYEQYIDYKLSLIKAQESIDTYLMLIADKDFNVILDISDSDIWTNKYYVNLIENLGVNISGISDNTDFIVIKECGEKVDCFENFHESENQVNTSIGTFCLKNEKAEMTDSAYKIYLNGTIYYDVPFAENTESDVRIYLIDKNTMEIVDDANFSL